MARARLVHVVAAVAAVVLLVSACGGGAGPGNTDAGPSHPSATSAPASPAGGESAAPGGPAGAVDACTFLTADQVSTLFGSPAGEPQPGLNVTGDDESACDWEPAEAPLGVVTLLQLQVFVDTRYLSRGAYDDSEILQDVVVPGASEAFVIDEGSGIGINMVVGTVRVVVHYTPGGGVDPATTLPALTIVAAQLAAAAAS